MAGRKDNIISLTFQENFMSGIKDRIGRHEHRFGQLVFQIRKFLTFFAASNTDWYISGLALA